MLEQARLNLLVTEVRQETPLIRAIRLAPAQDAPLPSWQAGAHIKVHLPQGDERSYSLINASADLSANTDPRSYLLGVRLEQPSQGGSVFMHALKAGDMISASAPSNNFPLALDGQPVILLAGGIGVTPLFSMAGGIDRARDFRFASIMPAAPRDPPCVPARDRKPCRRQARASCRRLIRPVRRCRPDGLAERRRAALLLRSDADDRASDQRRQSSSAGATAGFILKSSPRRSRKPAIKVSRWC